jgi:hypothetical protein
MPVQKGPEASLRLDRLEFTRLAWAFVVSIALHLLCFGNYEIGKKFGAWEKVELPAWLQHPRMLTEILKKEQNPTVPEGETPLLFVETTPSQAVPEPPKSTQYYSDKNTSAANPEADEDTGTPKITGTQTQVVKTEDVPRDPNKFAPLQPALPPEPAPAAEEEKPKPTLTPGDLAFAKPDPVERKEPGTAEQARPRTLQEARARLPEQQIPGERIKQVGGVKARLGVASLDAKATPFGAYDYAFIEAVSQRWFDLLESRTYAAESRGKVVLQFRLHYDGRITEMKVAENNVTEVLGLICQKAVLDPAPYAAWPGDMRRMLGETRNIQFTFYYN